jgi:Zn finger protein HypA/HybF involved in hydrogenase expression
MVISAKKIVKCEVCGYKFYTRNTFKPVNCPKCNNLVEVEEKPKEEVTTEEKEEETTTEKEETATEKPINHDFVNADGTPWNKKTQDKKLEIKPIKEKTKKMEKEEDEYFCDDCQTKVQYGASVCPSCGNELDWDSDSKNIVDNKDVEDEAEDD